MISFIPILLREKSGEITRHGCVAIDETGCIATYTDMNLSRAFAAMFKSSSSLYRITRDPKQLVKQTIETKDSEVWLSEMRRQIPSPYYGGPIETSSIRLDQIEQEYQCVQEESKDDYTYQRLG